VSGISFTGLGSGIDFDQIISRLLTLERTKMRRLESRKEQYENRNEAIGRIETAVSDLLTAVKAISSRSTLLEHSASSSDEDVLTATATAEATDTSYSIEVNQLASAEREVHAGLATKETLVGEGTFSYTYAGTTVSVETTAETTLEDLVDIINNDGANPGVTASLLEYDAGGGQVFHLVLAGEDTGADNTIAIDDVNTTLDGAGGTADFTSSTFQETKTAQNAQLRLDGYPAGSWIETDSNTITDVIDGVTLTLNGTGTVNLSITADIETIKGDINNFVDKYNEAVDAIKEETSYDPETQEAGELLGDYSMRFLRSTLSAAITGVVPGFSTDNDTFVMAVEIGIEIDGEGKIDLDEDKLDDAISEDWQAVASLFSANLEGTSDDQYLQYYDASSLLTTAGIYEVEADFDALGNLTAARIRTHGETEWRDADIDGSHIVGAQDNPEEGLRISAKWDGASATQTATVYVKQGFAATLEARLDEILDSYEGTLKLSKDYNNEIMGYLDDRILAEERRQEVFEVNLRARYARLEAALMNIQSQMNALYGLGY